MHSITFGLIAVLLTVQSVFAEPMAVSDWQKHLNENLEANIQKTNDLLNLERKLAHFRRLQQAYSKSYFLSVHIDSLREQTDRLRFQIDSSLILGGELSQEEFAKLLNVISANCGASIGDGKLQIVQRYDGGGSKLIEVSMNKALIQNATRADIGPDDAIRFRDPKDFTITAVTADPKIAPWTEVFRFDLKIGTRIGQDRYLLEAGSGFVVEGRLLTSVPWKAGELDSLTCYLKPVIIF